MSGAQTFERSEGESVRSRFVEPDPSFAPDGAWRSGYVLQDASGLIHAAGPGYDGTLFGWSPHDLVLSNGPQMVHPDDREVAAQVREVVRNGGGSQFVQIRARSRPGRWVWTEVEVRPHFPDDPRWGAMTVSFMRNVSASYLEHDVLGLLIEMRGLMASASTVPEAWQLVLERLVSIGGFLGGFVWERRDSVHRIGHGWIPDAAPSELAASIARATSGVADLGLGSDPDVPIRWIATPATTRSLLGGELVEAAVSSLMVPVERSQSDVVAVVELVSSSGGSASEDLIASVVRQLGDTVHQKGFHSRLLVAEQEFRAAFMDAPVGVAMFRPDGVFERVNTALCEFLGRSQDELVGLSFRDVTHPEYREVEQVAFDEMVAGGRSRYETEKRYLHADGRVVWANVSVSPLRTDDGTVVRFVSQVQDIDARKHADQQVQQSRARVRATFDESGIAMALVRADGQQPGQLLEANHAFVRLAGIDAHDLENHRILDLLGADDVEHFARHLEGLSVPGAVAHHSEARVGQSTGPDERWVRMVAAPVHDASLDGACAVVHLEDITERRRAQRDLARIALHDTLTDLPNRSLIIDRIRNAQTRSERSGRNLGLLFIDLDKFKQVNDSLGHEAGDRLLVEIARRIEAAVRPSDTVARIGGDEFVILCDEMSFDDVDAQTELESVATRIHDALRVPIDLDGVDAYCTASIGMDVIKGDSMSAESALGNADTAMYRAKARGRSRTEAYNAAIRQDAIDRFRMASELRLAIERDQIHVAYQPIVRVCGAEVVGAEALLRWTHPELGVVPPSTFIDVAEDSELIVSLGDFVLEQVCRDLQRLHADDGFYVSVNVSARQLSRSSFVDTYRDGLARHGLDSSRLAVELTENVLMDAAGSSLKQLGELRDMGANVGVDDFGTGYASLTYLKQLPINFVKVDRSFIDGLPDDRDDLSITDAVIGLARALGLSVIAEGVETQAQADELDRLGCGFAQGYLYGRPAPVIDA